MKVAELKKLVDEAVELGCEDYEIVGVTWNSGLHYEIIKAGLMTEVETAKRLTSTGLESFVIVI